MAYIGIICHKHDQVNTKERRNRDRDFGVHTMLICYPVVLFIVCRSLFNKSAVAGIRIHPPLRSVCLLHRWPRTTHACAIFPCLLS